jgi:hypothetical protein
MLCIVLALLTGGCSGINASKSISPLDFLIPGLFHIQNAPQNTNSIVTLAWQVERQRK